MGWETPQVTTASWAAADATKTKSSEPDWNAGVGAAQDSPASWTQQVSVEITDRFNSGTEISDAVPNGYKDEQDAWGPENGRDEGQRDFSDMQCYNCQGMGHGSRNCPEPQKERELRPFLDWSRHPEMTSGEAWAKLKIADAEKDLDDIKEYFEIYAKNTLGATFQSIEKQFREKNMNTRLVCLKKAIPLNKTNVSLQQVPDQQYAVGFQLTKKSRRTKMIDGMLADTYEDNFERLSDCGFTVASRVPVCYNVRLQCNQKGHIGKDCPEGRPDPKDRDMSHIVKVVCSNCEEEGHRLRICPVPRKFRSRGCRNCGDESHMVADCDQPKRPREGESCFNCGSAEHHGKDCTEERKPREDTRECYNCMKTGHIGRECPDPRKSRENRGQAPDPFAEAEPMNFTSPAAHETAPAWSTSSELCGWQPTEAPTPVSVGCW